MTDEINRAADAVIASIFDTIRERATPTDEEARQFVEAARPETPVCPREIYSLAELWNTDKQAAEAAADAIGKGEQQ